MQNLLLTSVAALSLLSVGTAQHRAVPASPQLLRVAKVPSTATVQSVPFLANDRKPFDVTLTLGGEAHTLHVEPNSLRALGHRMLVDDGESLREVTPPKEATYQGVLRGVPGSEVAVSLWKGQLTGAIYAWDRTWIVEPVTNFMKAASSGQHLVYTSGAVTRSTRSVRPNAIVECELAGDFGYTFYLRNGKDKNKTAAAAAAIMNCVDIIFRRDVEVCFRGTVSIVRTSSRDYVNTRVGGCGFGNGLLQEMQTKWNKDHTNLKRDLAVLFSGSSSSGSEACGIEKSVCDNTKGYGVAKVTRAFGYNVGNVAKAIAMPFAGRCADTGCWVGCIGGQLCHKIGPTAQKAIRSYVATLKCLSACTRGCRYPAEYAHSGQGCPGTGSGPGAGCVKLNWDKTSSGSGWGQAHVAIPATSGSVPIKVEGVELFTKAFRAVQATVRLLPKDLGGKPVNAPLATGTVTIGTSRGVYRATFAKPVEFAPNTEFFVALADVRAFDVPQSTSGKRVTHFWHQGNGKWTETGGQQFTWAYQLVCPGAKQRPLLYGGAPRLGRISQTQISMARPTAISALLQSVGTSSIDLTAARAPGCTLYVDLAKIFLITGAATDAAGTATFRLPLPNLPDLCGVKLYQQGIVHEPTVNGLGWVLTRRGEATLGQ